MNYLASATYWEKIGKFTVEIVDKALPKIWS